CLFSRRSGRTRLSRALGEEVVRLVRCPVPYGEFVLAAEQALGKRVSHLSHPDNGKSHGQTPSVVLWRSSPELLGGLEVRLLFAHLVSPPGLAAPARVAVLEALDRRAVSAQGVDEEDRRRLQQWVERPGPGVGHVVPAVGAAREEVA